MTSPYHPEQYWDEVAKNISARKGLKIIAGDDEPYYRYKRRRFLELFRTLDFTGKTVLEIGCGPGGNLEIVYLKGAGSVTGVDISSQMLALAKQNLSGKNIQLIRINGRNLPFPENSFDLVFTSTVLQHITNEQELKQLVKEICRVSGKEIYLFERIESRIKGHQTNSGRPVSYYASLMKENQFDLASFQSLPIQVSYYVCGAIRKLFNSRRRKEGERLSTLSVLLEKISLPLTGFLDKIIPGRRDVSFLRFQKRSGS